MTHQKRELNTYTTRDEFMVHKPDDIYVPGLFVAEPQVEIAKFVELTDNEVRDLASIQQGLRKALRQIMDVELCGLFVEEVEGRRLNSITLPLHVERLKEQFDVCVYQPHIEKYIESYANDNMHYDAKMSESVVLESINSKKNENGTLVIPNNKTYETKEKPDIIEVFDESELPKPPHGKKYFVCIGGEKNYQCFLADVDISRSMFMETFGESLDEVLKPVFEDDFLTIRQDAKYAIPGFYIICPKQHFDGIDKMPTSIFGHCMVMAKRVKEALAEVGVNQSHIYHDEKYRLPMAAHFWVLPIYNENNKYEATVYSRDIWNYLDDSPKYTETRQNIILFNNHIRNFLSNE